MEKQEFLNEEKYVESNKKLKTVGVIIMAIGACLILFGIIFLITNGSKPTAGMNETDYLFESSVSQMHHRFTGLFFIIPGIFLTFVGTMIRFIIGNQRNIMAYQIQQVMPIAQEGIEKITPTMSKTSKEVAKNITRGIKEGLKDDEEDK